MDPREIRYTRATAEPLALVAEQTEGADLLLLTTTRAFAPKPEEVVEAARKTLHPLGNLVVTGNLYRLASYGRSLERAGFAAQEVVLPLRPHPPFLRGRFALPGHLLALVAFRDPGHIQRLEEGGGGTILEEAPLPPEAATIPLLLVEAGFALHLELSSGTLAALVERYSEPGGLVVFAGPEAARGGLLALLLGRRSVAVLEESELVPAYKTVVRLLQDLSPSPSPAAEREPRPLRSRRR